MRIPVALTALLVALLSTGCTATAPVPENADAAPVASTPAPPAATPPATATPEIAAAAPKSGPATPAPAPVATRPSPAFDPSAPDRNCSVDSDCAVKNVGSCCGYHPQCVHKDAKTDPAAVRAQCEKDGMSSICGFEDIKGCQCVQGRCENRADGAVAM